MRKRFMQTQKEDIKEKWLDVDAGMQGIFSFNDSVNLRINGKFEGKLNTKGTLVIGEGAEIDAEILGEHITVAGTVRGNIKATKSLKLISPAFISGDLEAPTLSISEGAVINGKVKMGATKDTGSTKRTFTLDEVAEYLEIDKTQILKWADNGKLPGAKEDNGWIFDRFEVDNWISTTKVN